MFILHYFFSFFFLGFLKGLWEPRNGRLLLSIGNKSVEAMDKPLFHRLSRREGKNRLCVPQVIHGRNPTLKHNPCRSLKP